MNITFLIGNGFDLNIGLDTKYSDFLKEYAVITDEDSDVFKKFKSQILKDQKVWANAEKAFGEATKIFKEQGYTAEDFCSCHEDFCVKLAAYLLGQEQRLNYSALSDGLVQGFVSGVKNYKRSFREAEGEAITAAENTFPGGYTYNFLSFNYTSVLDLCVEMLRPKSGLLGARRTRNGTATNQLGSVLHVHGTVHKDLVLGVNDLSQVAEPMLFDGYDEEYINELIKPKTNEINQENADKKAFDLLKGSDVIYVYGMSIGETDKLWWERICELMLQKPNLHLILHQYDAPEDGLIRREFRLFVNKERKRFTAYSDLDDAKKASIEARIHIDRTNIFEGLLKIVESPTNEESSEKVLATMA